MKKQFPIVLCLSLFLFPFTFLGVKISIQDFTPSFGKWKGTLTYLDYSSGKPYTLPVILSLSPEAMNGNGVIRDFSYPNEPKANSKDTLTIGQDGSSLDHEKVVEVVRGVQLNILTTEGRGKDGNDHKPAAIRHIYELGKNYLSIAKEVKFDSEEKWIKRNQYSFHR